MKENVRTTIKISLKFVPGGPMYNIPALVQIIAWHRPGDKSLSESMVTLLTRICVTRPFELMIITSFAPVGRKIPISCKKML